MRADAVREHLHRLYDPLGFRLVVTGSRSVTDEVWVAAQLDAFVRSQAPQRCAGLVHGAAAGVDRAAAAWAAARGLPVVAVPYERGAAPGVDRREWGKRRNALMLDMAAKAGRLVRVCALWDGSSSGTANMVTLAVARGVRVAVTVYDPAGQADEVF